MAKAKRKPHVSGEVELVELATVRPNGWNPNECDAHTLASIERGFTEEGWLKSHALTIWRTDEKGVEKRLIIDGEHRWEVGTRLDMKHGPGMFIDGITEAQAKALTIKLDKRRGAFLADPLAALLAELRATLNSDDLAQELGFAPEELLKALPSPENLADGSAFPPKPPAPGPNNVNPTQGAGSPYTRVVQLYLSIDDHAAYHGTYGGAYLGFPEFFCGVDMRDGDAILFDPHAWHAVTDFEDKGDDAERISVVYYLRSRIDQCQTPELELQRAQAAR